MPTFRLCPAPTFAGIVPIVVPGATEPFKLKVTFKHHTQSAFDALKKAATEREAAGDPMPAAEWVGQLVVDWQDVLDQDDRPVPYSPTALAALLDNYPSSFWSFNRAYAQALTEAREKN